MSSSRSSVVLIILALLILGAAAYLMFGKNQITGGISADLGPASSAEQTFLGLTAQIDPISFDPGILSDPRFIELVDIRTVVVPEPSGRPDPFAPLGR